MNEKKYSVGKIKNHFRGKFSRNYINRLIREMTKEGEINWYRYSPISEDDARKVVKRLLKLGDDGRNRGFYYSSGYKYIKTPENSFSKSKNGYMAEHRYVMEQKLGRKLERNEYVYHISGDKSDNSEENLLLCNGLKELRSIKKSVVDLLPLLWENGVFGFNLEEKKYWIRV